MTSMAIKREENDPKSIQDEGASDKRKENQPSSSSLGKKQRTSALQGFQRQGRGSQGQG